ncbi:MAG: AAA family ATPase [Clostridiales Family XIII bacterium]|jgi:AAA15 family ATPase/GTPase|nr:AAA family ATPase [Clostridiales Family XIII bacterium]
MAINRVEIKDFLVFKDAFTADFCPGVNVIIGGNAIGKTTLPKVMYAIHENVADYVYDDCELPCTDVAGSIDLGEYFSSEEKIVKTLLGDFGNNPQIEDLDPFTMQLQAHLDQNISMYFALNQTPDDTGRIGVSEVFIPAQEMLSHSKGLLALSRERKISFDKTQIDIVAKAQLGETKKLSPMCKVLIDKIGKIIDGKVIYDNDAFFLKKTDDKLISFSFEASGYRKLGLLWTLLRNGLFEKDSVLFWDEPENSLNPELMPVLADALLELSRGGVQIFLATHSEILSSYFDALRKDSDRVMFCSLYKDGESIKIDSGDRFDLLRPNSLTAAQADLYEKEVERGLGNNEDR